MNKFCAFILSLLVSVLFSSCRKSGDYTDLLVFPDDCSFNNMVTSSFIDPVDGTYEYATFSLQKECFPEFIAANKFRKTFIVPPSVDEIETYIYENNEALSPNGDVPARARFMENLEHDKDLLLRMVFAMGGMEWAYPHTYISSPVNLNYLELKRSDGYMYAVADSKLLRVWVVTFTY